MNELTNEDILAWFNCKCEPEYYIEEHGNVYVLYHGRCNHKHGANLCTISDIAFNCDLKELERLLNRKDK